MAQETISAVARELGRLSEAMDRAKEDRAAFREWFGKVQASIDGVQRGLATLTNTMQTTSAHVSLLALEKCGERLDKIEGTLWTDDFKTSSTRISRLEDMAKHVLPFFSDERLPAVELTVKRWQRWIGEGWSLAGKIALAILASGVIGGGLFGFASKIASHVVP